MKRRIGIKRRLMAQRLMTRRRWVRNKIEADQSAAVSRDEVVDVESLMRTRLPNLLPDSLAA
ncbi:MAG TPA: hypothetical protein VLB68_03500 [Pyrinomonadaceae bacterium]|nr:hypothetical protein [Pyrinomonadaceae bacterium]